MKYIYITYEAILTFASDRFLQSSENDISNILSEVLRFDLKEWNHPLIHLHYTERGLVFFTQNSNYKKGIVFDLETFHAFTNNNDNRTIINIFQKTIKYAVRYYENFPLASCERVLPENNFTIIYPNPFVATHDVPKIIVARNTEKYKKKDCNFLTVLYYGTNGKSIIESYTTLNKVYEDIRNLNFSDLVSSKQIIENTIRGLSTTTLEYRDLKLDSHIGYQDWLKYYLTDTQAKFVTSNFVGPERLEGAAGTGKTLCLILRCIYILEKYILNDEEYHIVFFTHSMSTKDKIIDIFKSNWENFELCEEKRDEIKPKQSIFVTTLQEWSAEHLGTNNISDNEYLDKDALYSKQIQICYIEEAYKQIENDLRDNVLNELCSEKFKKFIQSISEEHFLELLRQEIAVLIKGRASGEFDVYKGITRPNYSLPLEKDADYKYVFHIFNRYQNSLMKIGQYDSDDITLSALGQVKTPIWNRRRIREGYDLCVVDETHLFNINELSIFHHVNKPSENNINIIYAIDKSQSIGDWGIDDFSIKNVLGISSKANNNKFNTVFRSSPDIVNLAFNILSSGVNLFMNFENPLSNASFDFVTEDEKKTMRPEYSLVENDKKAIELSVQWIEKFCIEKKTKKSNILIIGTSDILVIEIKKYLTNNNKPFELLESRSDMNALKKANIGNKFVVSSIEYVGGLEFDAVVIIGVDEGRVPPSKSNSGEAHHILNYAWHSKMYVAVTRARYAIKMFGEKSRGICEFLRSSIHSEVVDFIDN